MCFFSSLAKHNTWKKAQPDKSVSHLIKKIPINTCKAFARQPQDTPGVGNIIFKICWEPGELLPFDVRLCSEVNQSFRR